MGVVNLGCVLGALCLVPSAAGAGPEPAVSVTLARPDQQLERLLALFEGARASSPAAALAAWRRATGEPSPLGKAPQALIAFLNPEMVRELRVLDGAYLSIGFVQGTAHWSAWIPADEGTLGAVGTALALTDGRSESPRHGAAVDRLGPEGSPLMAHLPAGGTIIAGTAADLDEAIEQAREADRPRPRIASGWSARLDPNALGQGGPLNLRRLSQALTGLECRRVEAAAALEAETLRLDITGRFDGPPPATAALEPTWLDWAPIDRTTLLVALALDPSRPTWDRAFALADRIEKADPDRARTAPLRARLNLLALPAGLQPERDLWPVLRGVTVSAVIGSRGTVEAAAVILHTEGPDAARKVAERVGAPLESLLGHRLERLVDGPAVALAWGEGWLNACHDAREHPERSAGPALRATWGEARPQRAGAFWPGRLLDPPLPEASPVRWWGVTQGPTTQDVVTWEQLRDLVRRVLERLPAPPPDEGGERP